MIKINFAKIILHKIFWDGSINVILRNRGWDDPLLVDFDLADELRVPRVLALPAAPGADLSHWSLVVCFR